MPVEWSVQQLEACVTALIDYRGKTPRKTSNGIPLITAKIVKGGRIETPDEFISVDDYESWMRRGMVEAGDVVITTEAPLGEVAQLSSNRVALAQRLIALRGKPALLDNTFLKFLMQSEGVQEQLHARASGTTVLGIKQSELRKISLRLPPIDEQRAIAHILGTLDDRIELNRRLTATLKAIPRALFRSWFIDFEPVRAKAAGRDTKLPIGIGNLFPGRFAKSELGEIPDGWEVQKLGSLLELAYGKALKADARRDGSVPVYGSRGQVGWHDQGFFQGPAIVVGRKGNPGIVTLALAPELFVIDTAFCVLPCADCRFIHFLFHALETHDLASLGADSAVPGLNRNVVYLNSQVLPSRPLLELFDAWASVFVARAHKCTEDSRALAALRDMLLPKLISGKLRVKDAERFIERAM